MTRKPKFYQSLITVGDLGIIMFLSIVVYHTSPHIPMLIGCVLAGAIALKIGFKWEDIQEGMIEGVIPMSSI